MLGTYTEAAAERDKCTLNRSSRPWPRQIAIAACHPSCSANEASQAPANTASLAVSATIIAAAVGAMNRRGAAVRGTYTEAHLLGLPFAHVWIVQGDGEQGAWR